jgi:anti-sigma factor RsiW
MTDRCDYSTNILLYLDDELSGPGLKDFLSHLRECVACREELAAEKELSGLLRRSRPLYSASDALRSRVIAAIVEPLPRIREARIGFGRRILRRLAQPRSAGAPFWRTQAALVLLVIVGPLILPKFLQRSRGASYVEAAVAAHRSLLEGRLPLEVRTDSASAVTAWFTGKVPFAFRLPNSEESSGHEPIYTLVGGTLVNHDGGLAALVAYQAKQDKISLLVASSRSAVAAGGEEVPFGGLVFHYHKRAGFNVITWSNHDLTYALVSSLVGSGRPSCMVCHQSMADSGQLSALRLGPLHLASYPNAK